MSCQRCGGLLIDHETATGFCDKNTWGSFQGYRCVNCGHREDPVIRANHLPRTTIVRGRPGKIPWNERVVIYESSQN